MNDSITENFVSDDKSEQAKSKLENWFENGLRVSDDFMTELVQPTQERDFQF